MCKPYQTLLCYFPFFHFTFHLKKHFVSFFTWYVTFFRTWLNCKRCSGSSKNECSDNLLSNWTIKKLCRLISFNGSEWAHIAHVYIHLNAAEVRIVCWYLSSKIGVKNYVWVWVWVSTKTLSNEISWQLKRDRESIWACMHGFNANGGAI